MTAVVPLPLRREIVAEAQATDGSDEALDRVAANHGLLFAELLDIIKAAGQHAAPKAAPAASGVPVHLKGFMRVLLDDLHPSPSNPRESLTDLDDLARSLREVGMIQPIVAQHTGQHLQIVAGHRRHAAARLAGLTEVPVIVRKAMKPDDELLAMLVENGQRAGLDPIEEARALARLKTGGMTDADVARKIGRTQVHVGNRLALLSLPPEEQEQLRAGLVTLGAATSKAKVDAGRIRPTAKGKKSAQHLDLNHELGTRARARCQRLGHKSKGAASVGGIACGECWESVIRSDERASLQKRSADHGCCALCGTSHSAREDGDRA